jgi:zinc protease
MKNGIGIFLVVLALAVGGCTRKGGVSAVGLGGELGVQVKLDVRALKNGLRVILIEDHSVPIVTYQTWYRVGSVDEVPGKTGLAHLFEHLMFKGTPKYPAKQFFTQLEAKGAEVNAYTTRDYTVYYENLLPQFLEKAIEMEADRMLNLKLDDETLQTERLVVLEERRLRTDNSPEGRITEAMWAQAFKLHPYGWPVIGWPQDLLQTTTDDLIAFYRKHYQPANAALVVVGNFDPTATFAAIEKWYGSLKSGPRPERKIPTEPEQKEERRLVLRDRVQGQKVAWGYPVSSAEQDDSYALDVLANILFAGTSSRAYRRMVEEKEVALGVSGSAYTPTYPGLMIIQAIMKGNLPAEAAETELTQLISEVQSKDVSADEIAVAVRQLTVQTIDSRFHRHL